ncbi:MAG: AAA family ATPase [Cyanothece sp. SIO2G6]|nr:AAA family ATPase [Cyanothece sp. SIO2G6]
MESSALHTGLNTVLISGPTNHVGKTTVMRVLSAYWHRYRTAQTISSFEIPGMSALTLDEEPDLGHVWQALCQQQQDHDLVLVEGEGGLGTPVTYDTTIANLAWDWRLPTILVVPAQWDAIAPTIAAIALARQSHLDLVGIVLNSPAPEPASQADEIGSLLCNLTQVKLLGTVPFLTELNNEEHLCQVASDLLIENILGKLTMQKAYT